MMIKETFTRLQNNIFRWGKIVEDHGSNSTGERILLQNKQKGNEVDVVFAEMFMVASTNHEVMFLIPFEMPEGCQRLFQLQCTFASALDHLSPQTKSTAISASSAGGMDHPLLRRGYVIGTSSSSVLTDQDPSGFTLCCWRICIAIGNEVLGGDGCCCCCWPDTESDSNRGLLTASDGVVAVGLRDDDGSLCPTITSPTGSLEFLLGNWTTD